MNILISTMPQMGHITPILKTARQLCENGHTVYWHSGISKKDVIEKTGAKFIPFNKTHDITEQTVESQKYHGLEAINKTMEELFVAPIEGQVSDYKEICEEHTIDVVITDMCSLGAQAYYDLGGPIWVSVGINPYNNNLSPQFGSGKPFPKTQLQKVNNRIVNHIGNHFVLSGVTKAYNKIRQNLGLYKIPTNKTMFDYLNSPFLHLQGTTSAFEYPYPKFPKGFTFVGPMLADTNVEFETPTWWHKVINSEIPVIHVTQGTVAVNYDDLIKPTIAAISNMNILLIVTGAKSKDLGELPENVIVADFIPHSVLLKYTEIMITNGGYNGVKEALNQSVPLIVAGESEDKAEVASRVAWTESGINLGTSTPSSEQIKNSITEIVQNPKYRENAQQIALSFSKYDSPVLIEELLNKLLSNEQN